MTFNETLNAAVRDISDNGFTAERLAYWQQKIRDAALKTMRSSASMDALLKTAMEDVYRKLVEKQDILKYHPGISRFTVEKLKPQLRAELSRRIFASADLIKLNREEAVGKTLRRFSGWASSVPGAGSDIVDKVEVKADIKKAISQLSFDERRVVIDQSHKFAANLNNIIAVDGGAIAAIWNHRYVAHPRKEHIERDGKIFLIRDSWAMEAGLIKLNGHQYTDQIEQPAEWVFCRCMYTYVYSLRKLPDDFLTQKGRDELARVRAEIQAKRAA